MERMREGEDAVLIKSLLKYGNRFSIYGQKPNNIDAISTVQ